MEEDKEQVELNDEQMNAVSGGGSLWHNLPAGNCVCDFCKYPGPHKSETVFEFNPRIGRDDFVMERIHCGQCGQVFSIKRKGEVTLKK